MRGGSIGHCDLPCDGRGRGLDGRDVGALGMGSHSNVAGQRRASLGWAHAALSGCSTPAFGIAVPRGCRCKSCGIRWTCSAVQFPSSASQRCHSEYVSGSYSDDFNSVASYSA